MKNMFYTFSTVEEMVAFVNKAESCDFDVDICYNHLVIDGKSLMGVMNVGLGKSVEIVCHSTAFSPESLEYSISKNDGRANDKPRFYLLNP